MRILVVGGGTAGLINAIILKRFLNCHIDIVKSEKIGIVGVGEGSTEHFKEFLSFSGIDHYSIIKECGATYKGGILFKDFGSKTYMHSVGYPFDSKIAQYSHVYARQISKNEDYMQSSTLWNNRIPSWYINRPEEMPFNQFHFDTHKLNNFLTNYCKKIGMNVYNDEINDVVLNNYGNIDYLVGESKNYHYDFYIDATGFKRLLMSKLGAKWKSFSEYMKMNSAITFQTPKENEYNLWTLAKGMKYGWLFKLPVQGRCGNGYIYDSNYINEDSAKREVEELYNIGIDVGKTFKFDPGHLEKTWIKNCVAVGLSAMFVEPLEASSIGSTIQQSFLLMHRLENYNDKTINEYNKSFSDLAENIRDFIILHYITDRRDTEFWRDISKIVLPDSLNEYLEIWKNRIPIKEDFSRMSDYVMFKDNNFILVMDGLNLFNRDSIKSEYDNKYEWIKNQADGIIASELNVDSTIKTIGHKDFIKVVRDYL